MKRFLTGTSRVDTPVRVIRTVVFVSVKVIVVSGKGSHLLVMCLQFQEGENEIGSNVQVSLNPE